MPNPDGVRRALAGERNHGWFEVEDDDIRILAEPIIDNGEIVGVIEAGRETDARETVGFAGQMLLVSIPGIVAFATAGGWWLAGRALNPIDRISRTAARIEERDLSQRIDIDLPDDEVGRLAATFNAMLDRIEDAFSRQRQFTADAAHELRTPLALMRSQIDVALTKADVPPRERETLEALGDDVDRLTRMAKSLLSLARSDAGGVRLDIETVDLPDLLELLADQYRPLAAESGIALELDLEPVTVQADHDQLIQVLVNLLDNALHHSPATTTVTLGCRNAGNVAQIWVADQGPGIPPEHLPHVFERFYRVESGRDRTASSSPGRGIGLGLAISWAIVEAHGGTIGVASHAGDGAVVEIELRSI